MVCTCVFPLLGSVAQVSSLHFPTGFWVDLLVGRSLRGLLSLACFRLLSGPLPCCRRFLFVASTMVCISGALSCTLCVSFFLHLSCRPACAVFSLLKPSAVPLPFPFPCAFPALRPPKLCFTLPVKPISLPGPFAVPAPVSLCGAFEAGPCWRPVGAVSFLALAVPLSFRLQSCAQQGGLSAAACQPFPGGPPEAFLALFAVAVPLSMLFPFPGPFLCRRHFPLCGFPWRGLDLQGP